MLATSKNLSTRCAHRNINSSNCLRAFIRNKSRLWTAVKTKDWQAIALNYNGPGYKTFSYDTKLKAAYEKFAPAPKGAPDKTKA